MAEPRAEGSRQPEWQSSVSVVEDAAIFIRGYSLPELMGRVSFSTATYLVVRGRLPTPGEARVFDAILTSILDYSLQKPATTAARYCVSSNPHMVPGMATGVLGVGDYAVAPENAGLFIAGTFARFKESGESAASHARKLVAELRARRERIPGLGHPKFRGVDPRAERLRIIAVEEGGWGEKSAWYGAIHAAYVEATGTDIVINDVGMIASLLSDMGFTPPEMTGIAVVSSLPGVIAHISEELATGIRLRKVPDEDVVYDRTRRELPADLEAAGWTDQARSQNSKE